MKAIKDYNRRYTMAIVKNTKLFVFFLFLLIGLSGCQRMNNLGRINIFFFSPADREITSLQEAENAFMNGAYEEASGIYSKLYQTSENEVLKNAALYGLACSTIISAEDGDGVKKGIAQLQAWQDNRGEKIEYFMENPKMMALALHRKMEDLGQDPVIHYVATKREGELVEVCEREKDALLARIKTLQHQISVLEAIDQELQEKRKPL